MPYHKLANLVVLIHLLWIFVLSGGLILAIIFPWYLRVQVAVVTITAVSQLLMRFRCPLTKLEISLRRKIDPDYQPFASFVQHYLNKRFGIKTPKLVGGAKLLLTAVASWMLYLA